MPWESDWVPCRETSRECLAWLEEKMAFHASVQCKCMSQLKIWFGVSCFIVSLQLRNGHVVISVVTVAVSAPPLPLLTV